ALRRTMAQDRSLGDVFLTADEIGIRRIQLNDLRESLRRGYEDFNARPTLGLFVLVIYPLFALLLTLFLLGERPLHMAFPVVAGLALLGPVISVGLFEISRRRELGLDSALHPAFRFVHSSSFAPILALSIV